MRGWKVDPLILPCLILQANQGSFGQAWPGNEQLGVSVIDLHQMQVSLQEKGGIDRLGAVQMISLQENELREPYG